MRGILITTLVVCSLLPADTLGAGSQGESSRPRPGRAALNTVQPSTKPSAPSTIARAIFRGWEVQSVSAIRRTRITVVYPNYVDGKRVSNREALRPPVNGAFLVVLVTCKWATAQPPNDPPWIGKPDVKLIDENGGEYMVMGLLRQRVSGDLVDGGIPSVLGRRASAGPASPTERALFYFDVPEKAGQFWLHISDQAPLLAVAEVQELLPGVRGFSE